MESKQVDSSEHAALVQQFLDSDIVAEAMKFADIQVPYPSEMLYRIKRLFGYMCSLDGGVYMLYSICEAMEQEFEFSLYGNPELDGEPLCSGIIGIDGTWELRGLASMADPNGAVSPFLKKNNSIKYPYKDIDEETMLEVGQQIMDNSLPGVC